VNTVDISAVVFVFWPKIALPEVLCKEMNYHYANCTSPAIDVVSF
jgi:hypothetical protein